MTTLLRWPASRARLVRTFSSRRCAARPLAKAAATSTLSNGG
jgi:hypothetical protein